MPSQRCQVCKCTLVPAARALPAPQRWDRQHALSGDRGESLRRAATLSCSFLCRPHHNVTGGMKCLVEHIRLLRGRGHCLVAVHRSDSATTAMPPWSEVQADKDIVCGLHQRLGDVYPLADIDVVVVGIFHQVGPVKPSMSWRLAFAAAKLAVGLAGSSCSQSQKHGLGWTVKSQPGAWKHDNTRDVPDIL